MPQPSLTNFYSKSESKLRLIFILSYTEPFDGKVRDCAVDMVVDYDAPQSQLMRGDVIEYDFTGGGAGQVWPKHAIVRDIKDITRSSDQYYTFEIHLDECNNTAV